MIIISNVYNLNVFCKYNAEEYRLYIGSAPYYPFPSFNIISNGL